MVSINPLKCYFHQTIRYKGCGTEVENCWGRFLSDQLGCCTYCRTRCGIFATALIVTGGCAMSWVIKAFDKRDNYVASPVLFRRYFPTTRNNPVPLAHAIKTRKKNCRKAASTPPPLKAQKKRSILDTNVKRNLTELLWDSVPKIYSFNKTNQMY